MLDVMWTKEIKSEQSSYILGFMVIESVKTTSMENVSTGVLDKNKEHYLRNKDEAKKSYAVLRHIQLHLSKYKKMKTNCPLCQTYSPTIV